MSKEWTAKWIGRQDGDTFNPVFFKDFNVDFPISKATFYITALGTFEAYINGQRIGNDYLTPYRKNDDGAVPYYEYDVTDILYTGPESQSNSIDVFLGHGWDDEDDRIALRAEIVLERSGEEAEEALAMEFDEVIADPGTYADNKEEDEDDIFDLYEIDSFVKEEDPFDASDDVLNELIGTDEGAEDNAPELPELPETMDMPDTLAGREYHSHTRRMRRWKLDMVQDPEQEAAKELLADDEPVFEVFSEPEEIPEEDLFNEDAIQELIDESNFDDDLPDELGEMPLDVLEELEGLSAEQPQKIVPKYETQNIPDERGFSDSMPEKEMTDDEIQSILAEQEKQLASSIPKFFESIPKEEGPEPELFEESDLEEALGETGDFLLGDDFMSDVDSIADELADEFGEEASVPDEKAFASEEVQPVTTEESFEMFDEDPFDTTDEEEFLYGDVEGQVSFDFADQVPETMDEEKASEEIEDNGFSAADTAGQQEDPYDTEILGEEFETVQEPVSEEASDFEEGLFDEALFEDLPEEELTEDIFDEISGEVFEEVSETAEEPEELEVPETAEEPEELELLEEIEKPEEVEEVIEKPVKKESKFRKRFKAFDLAKKIGLTIGDDEAEPDEAEVTMDTPEDLGEYDTDEYEDMKQDESESVLSGPMDSMELPAFEDLFAEAESLSAEKTLPVEEELFMDEADIAEIEAALEEDLAETEEIEDAPEEVWETEALEDTSEEEVPEAEEAEDTPEEEVPEIGAEEESTETEPEEATEDNADTAEGVIPVPIILPEEEEETAEAEEETTEAAEVEETVEGAEEQEEAKEPILVIATDETWGYYGSDIEENRVCGYEAFNRLLWEGKDNPDKDAVILDCEIPLTEAAEEQVTVLEELQVQGIISNEIGVDRNNGEWTLDFCKQFSGFVSFQSDFPAGKKITLTFMDTLSGNDPQQQFVYVSDGIQETVCPHFAFFHCRYVKVTGWETEMDVTKFTGYRLFAESGELEVDSAEEIVAESADDSAVEVVIEPEAAEINEAEPGVDTAEEVTDEPEADIAEEAESEPEVDTSEEVTAVQEVDAAEEAAPEQEEDTSITGRAAALKGIWSQYESDGDKAALEAQYEQIRDAVDAVTGQDPEQMFLVNMPELEDDDTDPSFVATVSYYEMAAAAEKAAKALGKDEDEKKYAELTGNIREAFLDEFFTRSGRLAEDTQTAYVLALKSGLYDRKEKLAEDFVKQLKRDEYQLKCGKMGLAELTSVLDELPVEEQVLTEIKEKLFELK